MRHALFLVENAGYATMGMVAKDPGIGHMLDDDIGPCDRVPHLWTIGAISRVGFDPTQTTGQLETPFASGFLPDPVHGLEGIAGTLCPLFAHCPGIIAHGKHPFYHLAGTGFFPDPEKNFFE